MIEAHNTPALSFTDSDNPAQRARSVASRGDAVIAQVDALQARLAGARQRALDLIGSYQINKNSDNAQLSPISGAQTAKDVKLGTNFEELVDGEDARASARADNSRDEIRIKGYEMARTSNNCHGDEIDPSSAGERKLSTDNPERAESESCDLILRAGGGFSGASSGFEVLDMQSNHVGESIDHKALHYKELRAFMENRPQRSAAKCLREQEAELIRAERRALSLERQKERELEAELLRQAENSSPEEAEAIKKKLFAQRVRETEAKKNFVQFNIQNAKPLMRNKKKKRPRKAQGKEEKAAQSPDASIENIQTPRNNPPSLLSPGCDIQVAWQGLPKDLQKLYFDKQAEAESEAEKAAMAKAKEEAEEEKASNFAEKKAEVTRIEEERKGNLEAEAQTKPLTAAEKTKLALEFMNRPIPGKLKKDDSADLSKTEREKAHRARIEQEALKRYKLRKSDCRNKSCEKIKEDSPKQQDKRENPQTGNPPELEITIADANNVNVEAQELRAKQRKSQFAYSELCKRARQQVLKERTELLDDMRKRKQAARVLQRAIVRHRKRRKQVMIIKEMQRRLEAARNQSAVKLQTAYRGFKTRRVLRKKGESREKAARIIQRMVRNSYDWIKLLKQRIAVELQKKERQEEQETRVAREHFEWVQRSLARSKEEAAVAARTTPLKSLAPSAAAVRESIVRASTFHENEPEEEHGRNNEQRDGDLETKTSPGSSAKDLQNDLEENAASKQKTSVVISGLNTPRLMKRKTAVHPEQSSTHKRSALRTTSRRKVHPSHFAGETPRVVASSNASSQGQVTPIRHWDAHRRQVQTDRLSQDSVRPDEFTAMNERISHELNARVDFVHGRVERLKSTLVSIATRESRLPALRFTDPN